jgi:hypothetical protein
MVGLVPGTAPYSCCIDSGADRCSSQPAPGATYRRRPTANPSSAPPTTSTMITTRMNYRSRRETSGLKLGGEQAALGRSEDHGYRW